MMPPKISAEMQERIEVMLTKWTGKLTWAALVSKIEIEFGLEVTRQTLSTYLSIKACYKKRKSFLRGVNPSICNEITSSDVKLVQQIEHLRAEIIVLQQHNAEQLRMIERIFANANTMPNMDLRNLVKVRPEEIQKK